MAGAAPARAEPSASELALARSSFVEAVKLESEGRWSEAAAKIRDALAVKETPGLRYHLAHCQEQMGQLVQASLDYERAEELIRGGARAPDVEELLSLASQRLAARIPKLRLLPPANVPGLSVELDGRAVSPVVLGKAAPVDPGIHHIVARAPGYRVFESDIAVSVGQSYTLELALVPIAERSAEQQQSQSTAGQVDVLNPEGEQSSFGAREVTLIAEVTLTLAALGVGIGYAFARADAQERVTTLQAFVNQQGTSDDGACYGSERPPACAELRKAIDDHRYASTLSTIGFVGAGVGAAATAVTWMLWPTASDRVAVAAGPRGVEVRAGLRF